MASTVIADRTCDGVFLKVNDDDWAHIEVTYSSLV